MTDDDIKQISILLDDKLNPIQKVLTQHGKLLEQHSQVLTQHGKILTQHGKILTQHGRLLRSLKKDQNTMLKMLDKEQMEQIRRLKRVELHLGLNQPAS